jgi:hypothetical protein
MTIGPMPRHPGIIRELTGGALVVPTSAHDRAGGDPDGFAQALRTVAGTGPHDQRFDGTPMRETVERFNENGFFSNTGALSPPATMTSDVHAGAQAIGPQALAAAMMPPVDSIDPAGMTAAAVAITAADAPSAASPATVLAGGAGVIPLGSGGGASSTTAMTSAAQPMRPTGETVELEMPIAFPRPAKLRPPSTEAAKSPVSVVVDAGDGAAAIAVSARGLTDRQIGALRVDIMALLRRHGLVLDELKLNGRPTGQGKHDRSGG